MIVGIGVDIVDITRFGSTIARVPGLAERLLVDSERSLTVNSQAARFAAEEALAKALGSPGSLSWHDAWIVGGGDVPPAFEITGAVQARCEELGVTRIHVSLSHDGGVATAFVVAEGE